MSVIRRDDWWVSEGSPRADYTEEQTLSALQAAGVSVIDQTGTDWKCLCPFHPNTDTPAMTVGKFNGLYLCHNGGCGKRGNFEDLVMNATGSDTIYEARRLINSGGEANYDLQKSLDRLRDKPLPNIPKLYIDSLIEQFWGGEGNPARQYMYSRGFDKPTLKTFEVGLDDEMVTVPVYTHDGSQCIGTNGRSYIRKRFKLSSGMPKTQTLFNLHRARSYHRAIICESSFDVMRLHQVGYSNAVCSLGSTLSETQAELLGRYFGGVTIMTDDDPPGRAFGLKISERMRGLSVKWAYYGDGKVYPGEAGDVCEMSHEEIRACVYGSVSDLYYKSML